MVGDRVESPVLILLKKCSFPRQNSVKISLKMRLSLGTPRLAKSIKINANAQLHLRLTPSPGLDSVTMLKNHKGRIHEKTPPSCLSIKRKTRSP